LLAGAVAWLAVRPPAPGVQEAVNQRLQELQDRIAALEQRPAVPPDLASLPKRVDALEQRQVPDLHPLEARVAALEQRPANQQQLAKQLSDRVDTLTARMNALAGQDQNATAAQAKQLDTLDKQLSDIAGRLGTLEHNAAQTAAQAQRAGKLARIQAAEAALDAGRPLGEVPGAPQAVTRFASTNPPTLAQLRLDFPKAEQAALAAQQPQADGKSFLQRVLSHTEELVTVRQGDHVVIGSSAAGVLARARASLDAGDLNGAIDAVSSLSGPPAQAMASWLEDARALQAARSALTSMAAQA
jgi:hypothetical protein